MTTNSLNEVLRRGEERERAFVLHPVVKDTAKIPTPSIKVAFNVITNAIIQRDPGVAFTAEPRFGKTSAIDMLEYVLPQTFPDVPIFRTIGKKHQNNVERTLFSDILEDFGIDSPVRLPAAKLRTKIINMMISACQAMESDRVLLFVDEAQKWSEAQLSWVCDISNALGLADIRMITVMFAHPELHSIREDLMKHRTDLIGRFLVRPRTFKGVETFESLKEIMGLLDDPLYSDYPEGSGIAYSQFFRPHEYDHEGWRLADEAEPCWRAFRDVMDQYGGHYEIGMRWLMVALRTWLCMHWEYEHGELPADGNLWSDAVDRSDFSASLVALRARRIHPE